MKKLLKGLCLTDIGADLDGVITTEVGRLQVTLNGKNTGCGAKVDNHRLEWGGDGFRSHKSCLYFRR